MLPAKGMGPIVFLGGKDYVPLFQALTAAYGGERIVFYNSRFAPASPRLRLHPV